ncbi:MAG: DNA internalization-related competence protein ComEC/Rec2 [Gemmatimonadaceae bacterium]
MPLVAWSVLSYAAALVVALSASAPQRVMLVALGVVAGIALAIARRHTRACIAALVAAAGLMAMGIARSDSACAARLASAHRWTVAFETDASASGIAHGIAGEGECASRATLLITSGHAQAGERAEVRGRATTDPRGIFIENAELARVAPGALGSRLRAAAGRRIDRIFGGDAPMARALVIADMSAISAEQRDRFARSGLVHMLSVSGLHVGIVALALELLASVCRLPKTPSRIATLALLTAYVAAIGAPPPAVRAAVMLGALVVTRVLQRPTSPWAILALGAAAPLWDPRTALDLGWQLSVAGTAALIAGGSLARRMIPHGWRGWRRSLATAGVVSVVATAVTAPLVAWSFGRVSLAGPVTNLLADPVMGLLQPLLFLAMSVPIAGVERLCADASHVLIAAFDAIAVHAARIPGAAPVVLPTVTGAVAAAVSSIALIVACISKRPARAACVAAAGIALLVVEPFMPHASQPPELHMIDVGQGDALAIRTARGRWIVVDAGRSWLGGDAGRNTVVPYLARRGGDVALFVLSHPHADHVGGAASLFALRRPARFLDPGYVGTSTPYRAALAQANAGHIPWQRVRPGDSLVVDDVVLLALAPDSAWAAALHDANLASSVLLARIGRHRVLFTGDAEGPEEDWLLARDPGALRADVLKVGHHGSRTSTTRAFLDAVSPSVALVSVGARNTYGLPDEDVMARLDSVHAAVLRTDQLGTVVLRFLDDGIEVNAHGERWRVAAKVIR